MIERMIAWFRNFEYEREANTLVQYIERTGYYRVAHATSAILLETKTVLSLAYQLPLGWMPFFTWYGVNPTELSEAQLANQPVLLLHGNSNTQGVWLSVAEQLQLKYPGPVFTINLNNGNHNPADKVLIEAKFTEIKNLYAQYDIHNCQIHLVGHSRGAYLAYYESIDPDQWSITVNGRIGVDDLGNCSLLKFRPDVGRVIMIGSGKKPPQYSSYKFLQEKFCAIIGTKDRLWPHDIALDEAHRVKIPSGHAELLMHPQAHMLICGWLNEMKERSKDNQLPTRESRYVQIFENPESDDCVIC